MGGMLGVMKYKKYEENDKGETMTVKQLIAILKNIPEEKILTCQLCPNDGSVGNVFFEINDVPHSTWAVQLKVYHPKLKSFTEEEQP
jgi:hypothetical protein